MTPQQAMKAAFSSIEWWDAVFDKIGKYGIATVGLVVVYYTMLLPQWNDNRELYKQTIVTQKQQAESLSKIAETQVMTVKQIETINMNQRALIDSVKALVENQVAVVRMVNAVGVLQSDTAKSLKDKVDK